MIEEKKEYIAPKMEIIDFNHESALLQGSCVGNECYIPTDLLDK